MIFRMPQASCQVFELMKCPDLDLKTIWRYTLNHKGAYMGWLPTPKATMTPVSRKLPGLDNFYMVGQWVMPGGGVPPCLYPGRQAVQILCRLDKKPFLTTIS